MSVQRIAGRYAKSLLDLAVDQGVVDNVVGDMQHFAEAIKNRDLHLLVKSPIINTTKKQSIFKEIFGGKYHALTEAFFDIILRKGRESFLPEMAGEFHRQYNVYKGITKVKVTTATPLAEDALAEIKSRLLSSDLTSKEVEVETVVDPEIIGGFVLNIGDKLYDASVLHKLDTMRKSFKDNSYVAAI